MTRRRRRPVPRPVRAAVAAVVLAGVLAAVLGSPNRAAAGTAGAPYGVYVTVGDGEDELPINGLAGAPGVVIGQETNTTVSATAINSTATLGIATVTTFATLLVIPPVVWVFSVPGGATVGRLTGIAPVAYAMDPTDPYRAFGVSGTGTVYSITLGPGPPAFAPIATLADPVAGGSPTCSSLASAPDGSAVIAACNTGRDGFLAEVPTNGGPVAYWTGVPIGYAPVDNAVAPDGSAVYSVARTATESVALAVSLPLVTGSLPLWQTALVKPVRLVTTMTVSGDGSALYVGGDNGAGTGSVVQRIATAGGAAGAFVNVPLTTDANGQGGLTGMALSPDGATLVTAGQSVDPATGVAADLVYPVAVATAGLVVGGPSTVLGTVRPVGPRDVAVTPDQAPVANLAPASGRVGTPVTLDAASSTIAYGSIASFAWDFGDGQTAVTAVPTVSHVFSSPGTYSVAVTETDAAGTSVPPAPFAGGPVDGPGTTAFLDAGPAARISAPVAIGPAIGPPPPLPTTTTSTTAVSSTTTVAPHHTTTTTVSPGRYHPSIRLTPRVGDPGTIVAVTGQGFPPGKAVTVSWAPGSGQFTEIADLTGHLAAQRLYVLTPDLLGPRQARATVLGDPATASAPFLVVPGTAEPGRAGDVLFRSEGP